MGTVEFGALLPELGRADFWWTGYAVETASDVADAVAEAGARHVSQTDLLDRVRAELYLAECERLTREVAVLVEDGRVQNSRPYR